MRIFLVSFFLGILLGLGVEVTAQESTPFSVDASVSEPLPMPITSKDATGNESLNRVRQADIIKASRVERAKVVAQARLERELLAKWSGMNTARPQVNAGYNYLSPPRVHYRWFGPAQPVYLLPYGMPIQ